jgi:Fe-S-cluster containining protein
VAKRRRQQPWDTSPPPAPARSTAEDRPKVWRIATPKAAHPAIASPGGLPDGTEKAWGEAATTQRDVVLEILAEGRTTAKLREIAENAAYHASEGVRLSLPVLEAPLACREGCSWCCRLSVSITVPEVLRIAEHVRATFDADQVAALQERLAALDTATRGLGPTARGRARLPCALLVNDRCSVYEVRPVKCVTYYSCDAGACERKDTPPLFMPPLILGDGIQAGVRKGLEQAGLSGGRYELCAALRIALDVPDAAERYLAGEPVFYGALLPY